MTANSFETQHVHLVYEHIAHDFSRTRHSPWPFVQRFLEALPAGSLVLDAGCGNGKYLGVDSVLSSSERPTPTAQHPRPTSSLTSDATSKPLASTSTCSPASDPPRSIRPSASSSLPARDRSIGRILSIGLDMSLGLLTIASSQKGHEVVRGDCFDLSCWRPGSFDHAISIATIHHFATVSRRIESIKQLILSVLPPIPSKTSTTTTTTPTATAASPRRRPCGSLLIVVWAFEQDPSLEGLGSARKKTKPKGGAIPVDLQLSSTLVDQEGQEDVDERDVFVPWQVQRSNESGSGSGRGRRNRKGRKTGEEEVHEVKEDEDEKPTFQRYYHLFRAGELTQLVRLAAEQLGAAFEDPESWKGGGTEGDVVDAFEGLKMKDGWEKVVRMKEERWERENWVGMIEVGWRQQRRGPK